MAGRTASATALLLLALSVADARADALSWRCLDAPAWERMSSATSPAELSRPIGDAWASYQRRVGELAMTLIRSETPQETACFAWLTAHCQREALGEMERGLEAAVSIVRRVPELSAADRSTLIRSVGDQVARAKADLTSQFNESARDAVRGSPPLEPRLISQCVQSYAQIYGRDEDDRPQREVIRVTDIRSASMLLLQFLKAGAFDQLAAAGLASKDLSFMYTVDGVRKQHMALTDAEAVSWALREVPAAADVLSHVDHLEPDDRGLVLRWNEKEGRRAAEFHFIRDAGTDLRLARVSIIESTRSTAIDKSAKPSVSSTVARATLRSLADRLRVIVELDPSNESYSKLLSLASTADGVTFGLLIEGRAPRCLKNEIRTAQALTAALACAKSSQIVGYSLSSGDRFSVDEQEGIVGVEGASGYQGVRFHFEDEKLRRIYVWTSSP